MKILQAIGQVFTLTLIVGLCSALSILFGKETIYMPIENISLFAIAVYAVIFILLFWYEEFKIP